MHFYRLIIPVFLSLWGFLIISTHVVAAGPCPLAGDANTCDGIVNILDYAYLSSKFGTNDVKADLNSDGAVNILDFQIVNQNFGRSAPTPTASSAPTPTRTPTPPPGATPTITPTSNPNAPPGISVLNMTNGMQIPTYTYIVLYDLTGDKTQVKSILYTLSNGQTYKEVLTGLSHQDGQEWLNKVTYGTHNLTVQLLDANDVPLSNPEAKKTFNSITFYKGQDQWYPPLVKPSAAQIANGVPVCPASLHDKTKWHPLFIKDYGPVINQTTGERQGCHFTHEHHDDPHFVDDIFGPPGEWFGMPGQEISYPWQTYVGAGESFNQPPTDHTKLENGFKHEGYKWIVRKNLPCLPFYKGLGCFRAFRWQQHALGATPDHVSRFHSYSFEALVEHNGKQGIIRYGGWTDTNTFHIGVSLTDAGKGLGHIPLPGDPSPLVFFSATSRRINAPDSTSTEWYMEPGWRDHFHNADVEMFIETFGGLNPSNPNELVLKCPDFKCPANGSTMSVGEYRLHLDKNNDFPVDSNGIINFNGYFNRHLDFATGCTSAGLDCIPAVFSNVPKATYHFHFNNGFESPDILPDYDTSPANLKMGTEWWITYPN